MLLRLGALVLTAVVVAATFAPVRGFALLNWDDDAVITRNEALVNPGVVGWAFTTTYMEHYQPLSWLTWAAVMRDAGTSARALHTANLVAHVICALLVAAVTIALLRRVSPAMNDRRRTLWACAAALLYALHPLRAEVVAWVSALPYALALSLALLSLLAWLRTDGRFRARWWVAAFVFFAASLAARPVALGFPIVLAAVDVAVRRRTLRDSVMRVWPFALLAIGAAVLEGFARAPGVADVSWAYRGQSAARAPFVYLSRTIVPIGLTPLDVLPTRPEADPVVLIGALLALAAVVTVTWHTRNRRPVLAAGVVAYLALLAPAAGLVASGVQATADRYTYLPGVVLAVAVAAAGATWAGAAPRRDWIAGGAAILVAGTLTVLTRDALRPWSDSLSLWTRAAALDPGNDVALYNLALALDETGRRDEAADRYRQVLVLQPAHAAARANLDRLDAARLEQEGNDAAGRGDLSAAARHYAAAVARDPQRTHAQAGLGMALATLGRSTEAIAPLQEAIRQGDRDPAVPNALAVMLIQSGRLPDARRVLESALAVHQTDVGLGHTLARLLATSPELAVSDAQLALRLAQAIADATGGRDPRVLDTLATALEINGRRTEAVRVAERGAALAAQQGDQEMAREIAARAARWKTRR